MRPPGVRHMTFLVYSLNLLHKLRTSLDFSFFCNLIHLYSLNIKFLFVEPRFCFTLPPNSTSRWISCASLGLGDVFPTNELAPFSYMPCPAHKKEHSQMKMHSLNYYIYELPNCIKNGKIQLSAIGLWLETN